MAFQCSERQSFKALKDMTEVHAVNAFWKLSAKCGKLLPGNLCDFKETQKTWGLKDSGSINYRYLHKLYLPIRYCNHQECNF